MDEDNLVSVRQSVHVSKRKRQTSPSSFRSMPPPGQRASRARQSLQPVLRSAFQMPSNSTKWTRSPRMEKLPFIRRVAVYEFKGLDVNFILSDKEESLEIALDFEAGDAGSIGKGFSKIGIYVRLAESGLTFLFIDLYRINKHRHVSRDVNT